MRGRGRGRGRVGGGSRGGGRGRGYLAPRTGKQANAAANAEAGAQFNGPIREERQQAKGSRKREQDIGSWYAQLAADYGAAAKTGSAALQSVENTSTQQLAEAGARSQEDQQRLGAEDAQFANLIGGPKDASGLAKIAQAGAAADRSRVALAEPVAATQANYVGRVAEQKGSTRLQGIEARKEERDRRTKIQSDIAGKRQEKGAARVSALDKIREADRGYVMELKKFALAKKEARTAAQAAAATAALARVKAAHEAAQDAISNRQAQERIGISAKNAITTRRSQRATARHYKHENKGGLTPSERNAKQKDIHNAAVEATNLYKAAKKPPKTAEDWAAFAHLVSEQSEISPTAATQAVDRLRKAIAAKAASKNRRLHEGKIAGH